jgi:phosphoglycerol transferase MdoB-like AlkP superfamily enzyme
MKRLKNNGYRTGFFTSSIFSYDNLHKAKFMDDFDMNLDFFKYLRHSKKANWFSQAVEEEIVAESLKEFISEDKNKPFFALYFAFWSHSPYRVPDRDISGLPPLERYYETLKYLNGILSDVRKFINENGYDQNTIIVLVSDHGDAFGEHDNYTHAGHLFEEDIKIPLILSIPGIDRKIINTRLSSNIDIAPTIAYLAGIEPSNSWEGQNLLNNNFKEKPILIFSRSSVTMNGIVDGNYKYFYDLSSGNNYFFDLVSDPEEKNNIAEHKKEEIDFYKKIIKKWISYQDYKISDR